MTCTSIVLAFKWQDWLASLGLDYEPTHLPRLFDPARSLAPLQRAKGVLKRGLQAAGVWRPGWQPPPRAASTAADRRRAVAELRAAALRRPSLSDAARLDSHVARYAGLLDSLVRSRLPRERFASGLHAG